MPTVTDVQPLPRRHDAAARMALAAYRDHHARMRAAGPGGEAERQAALEQATAAIIDHQPLAADAALVLRVGVDLAALGLPGAGGQRDGLARLARCLGSARHVLDGRGGDDCGCVPLP